MLASDIRGCFDHWLSKDVRLANCGTERVEGPQLSSRIFEAISSATVGFWHKHLILLGNWGMV